MTLESEEAAMLTSHQPINIQVPMRVPTDLSEWAGRNRLVSLALEAATETGAKAWPGGHDPFALARAKTLLALLT